MMFSRNAALAPRLRNRFFREGTHMNRITLTLLTIAATADARKFYADDPLLYEPKPRDAGAPKSRKLSDIYDLFSHQFSDLGERQPDPKTKKPPIRARAINTIEDPLQGAWWEQRHYYKRMSRAELQRGPGNTSAPSTRGKWTIVGAKAEGVTPGFQMIDADKRRYFVKFDPLSNPEIATAADQISSKLFYALGYHVPENYLIYFDVNQLELGADVELADAKGKTRKMTQRDLYEILLKVPKNKEGKYRGTASLALPGKPIGPPRYYSTRADDPNDVVPHEHRRDQRGLRLICAWLAHEDSRAINNIDVLATTADGVKYIKHFLLDFGSTLGSASTKANSPRSGLQFFDWTDAAKNFFSLGLHIPYVDFAKYPHLPSVGRFEAKVFDPERWVPEYPNPAFRNALPDDDFWMAKQIMSLRDDEIRAMVETGQYTDPRATEWVTKCLIERRDKIGKVFFAKVLPIDRFRVENGTVAWDDLGGAKEAVTMQWHSFDNETEKRTAMAGATTARMPEASSFLCLEVVRAARPAQKVFVYFRPGGQLVGVEREW
jgi:hypothetical protein